MPLTAEEKKILGSVWTKVVEDSNKRMEQETKKPAPKANIRTTTLTEETKATKFIPRSLIVKKRQSTKHSIPTGKLEHKTKANAGTFVEKKAKTSPQYYPTPWSKMQKKRDSFSSQEAEEISGIFL